MTPVRRLAALAVLAALVLAACAVPREREVTDIDKIAATDAEVLAVGKQRGAAPLRQAARRVAEVEERRVCRVRR